MTSGRDPFFLRFWFTSVQHFSQLFRDACVIFPDSLGIYLQRETHVRMAHPLLPDLKRRSQSVHQTCIRMAEGVESSFRNSERTQKRT